MVNQCESVELTTTMFLKKFNIFRTKGREINLGSNPDVSFSEIAPDEQAIFCLPGRPIVTMVYVATEERFEYRKKIMNILLVVPKNGSAKAVHPSYHGKKSYTSDPHWYLNY